MAFLISIFNFRYDFFTCQSFNKNSIDINISCWLHFVIEGSISFGWGVGFWRLKQCMAYESLIFCSWEYSVTNSYLGAGSGFTCMECTHCLAISFYSLVKTPFSLSTRKSFSYPSYSNHLPSSIAIEFFPPLGINRSRKGPQTLDSHHFYPIWITPNSLLRTISHAASRSMTLRRASYHLLEIAGCTRGGGALRWTSTPISVARCRSLSISFPRQVSCPASTRLSLYDRTQRIWPFRAFSRSLNLACRTRSLRLDKLWVFGVNFRRKIPQTSCRNAKCFQWVIRS